jgi:hypothetical protein
MSLFQGLLPITFNFNITATTPLDAVNAKCAQLSDEFKMELTVKKASGGYLEVRVFASNLTHHLFFQPLICVRAAEFRLSDVYMTHKRFLGVGNQKTFCTEYNFMAEMVDFVVGKIEA